MKGFSLRLGIVAAGFTLATVPAFGQARPSESGPAPAAADRSTGGGAASSGSAVDRGSGGSSGGGGSVASSGGSVSSSGGNGAISSGGGGSSFSSPSAGAISSPSAGSSAREVAPRHRDGFSSGMAYFDEGQRATPRSSGPSGGGGSGSAVTRGGGSSSPSGSSSGGSSAGAGSRSGSSDNPGTRATGRTRTGPPSEASASTANNLGGAREVPTWSRPRGDRPVTGTAVERTVPIYGGGGYGGGYPGAGYGYGGYYDPWYGYYSPYRGFYSYYPYYGFGMGYGLYSGFGWAPYFGDMYGDPYGGGYPDTGGSTSTYGRGEQGNLKLKVKPRAAKVYVDGYYVGTVDEFDGSFQKLALNTGRHKVEVKADGFETAEFDVLINPQQTVTFQGELKRIQ
jgi:hypothetical protein